MRAPASRVPSSRVLSMPMCVTAKRERTASVNNIVSYLQVTVVYLLYRGDGFISLALPVRWSPSGVDVWHPRCERSHWKHDPLKIQLRDSFEHMWLLQVIIKPKKALGHCAKFQRKCTAAPKAWQEKTHMHYYSGLPEMKMCLLPNYQPVIFRSSLCLQYCFSKSTDLK